MNEFVSVLVEAVVIVLAVSFIGLGFHRRSGRHPWWKRWYIDMCTGLVVGITIPLVLVLPAMYAAWLRVKREAGAAG